MSAVTNGQFGTLTFRRAFTNAPGAPVTALRFRVVDITTRQGFFVALQAPSAPADLRLLSNVDAAVTRTDGSPVTLQALTLEQPPNQQLGGGLNATVRVVSITTDTPLASGA